MSEAGRRGQAPRNGRSGPPRIVEKAGLVAYRAAAWLIGRLPARPAEAVIGLFFQASYLAWPKKRRWSNANFGHITGRPPDDPQVRRLALRAYRSYARYLVELMRLPRLSREEHAALMPDTDIDAVERTWRGHDGGLIFVLGHIGSNEAVGAAIASRGWPITVVADDSTFPELFEELRRIREAWGVRILPWRSMREIYGVLRRREILALLIDWGYRPDGIPVRLGDAWTALPGGPAVLAAKTGAQIMMITVRRRTDGLYHAEPGAPFTVDSTAPADVARATQRIADELEAAIRAAPEQWYSFKPIWPATVEEQRVLETRAAAMLVATDAPRRRRAPAAVEGVPADQGVPAGAAGSESAIDDKSATKPAASSLTAADGPAGRAWSPAPASERLAP